MNDADRWGPLDLLLETGQPQGQQMPQGQPMAAQGQPQATQGQIQAPQWQPQEEPSGLDKFQRWLASPEYRGLSNMIDANYARAAQPGHMYRQNITPGAPLPNPGAMTLHRLLAAGNQGGWS